MRNDDGTFRAKDKQKVEAGKKGGKVSGESKARFGESNARFDPKAERRPCCGAHAKRSHKKTCPNHRLNRIRGIERSLRSDGLTSQREIVMNNYARKIKRPD
tara:strand:+ start:491 stop:796 length:306 start_codon:yes stop_codon:yes gene_type:complete